MVGPYGDQQWQEYGFSAPVANDLMTSRAGSRKLLTTAFTAASDRDLKARAWSGRRGPLTGRAGRVHHSGQNEEEEVVTKSDLSFVDSDGHVLEHPTAMPDYAPKEYRDRIWHMETDTDGAEWLVWDGVRSPGNGASVSGTAGMSEEMCAKAMAGELRYTEVRPAAYNAKPRLADMDSDDIDKSVLYPTQLLGIQANADIGFANAQCQAYNNWLSDHVSEGDGRLFGAALLPQQDIELATAELRRAAKLPGMVAAFIRPNPTEDWQPFSHRIYDPLWAAASDTGMPLGLHPFLDSRLPGACKGMHFDRVHESPPDFIQDTEEGGSGIGIDNIYFSQALSNPFDMMSSMAFLLAGGVCERFPELRLIFLEANGGWLVPWLERLDHHAHVPLFRPDVLDIKMDPSEYFRRQCWISFDADESTLAFTANSPLCGADRIVWASDYPHPDAKFPGTTDELYESIEDLSDEQQRQIAGASSEALYGI
jgi:predicted TIM-barrel fold metal-dependent hydrolase